MKEKIETAIADIRTAIRKNFKANLTTTDFQDAMTKLMGEVDSIELDLTRPKGGA